jgi:signal peptidase I
MVNDHVVNPAVINPGSSEMVCLFEDILNRGLSLRIQVTGRSMTPFLRGGEILTIRKVNDDSLRRGDLLFFRDKAGHPILHRIIRKQRLSDGRCVLHTKGDALVIHDEPVMGTEALGKVCIIEKTRRRIGRGRINMESFFWKNANYLLALFYLSKSEILCLRSKIISRYR